MLAWLLNLDFAASEAAAVVTEEAVQTGGGRGAKAHRKAKYPRRILLGSKLVWVRNAEEERQALAEYIASLEAAKAALEQRDAPAPAVAKAKVAIVRAERRLEKVEDRAGQWLKRLQDEDDEILLILH